MSESQQGTPATVGHGVIRLRTQPALAAAAALPPAPVAPPEPVGHGRIRLIDRSLQLPEDATDAAEADIFAVLSSAG
jgi:hypothetical protein